MTLNDNEIALLIANGPADRRRSYVDSVAKELSSCHVCPSAILWLVCWVNQDRLTSDYEGTRQAVRAIIGGMRGNRHVQTARNINQLLDIGSEVRGISMAFGIEVKKINDQVGTHTIRMKALHLVNRGTKVAKTSQLVNTKPAKLVPAPVDFGAPEKSKTDLMLAMVKELRKQNQQLKKLAANS